MNLQPITVSDNKGGHTNAHKAVCPKCSFDAFMILIINGHNHLQCTQCMESYCQGGCETTPAVPPNCPICHGEREANGNGGFICHFCGSEMNV